MKQIFRCDYCSFMGTFEEVQEHEEYCPENYNRRSCGTCIHKKIDSPWYKCDAGKEIPYERFYFNCEKYERKEKTNDLTDLLFGDLFGRF